MGRYIIISLMISIFGHTVFFTLFDVNIYGTPNVSPGMYLYTISEEQFSYINLNRNKKEDIVISPLTLFERNRLLSKKIEIVKDGTIINISVEQDDEQELEEKKSSFQPIWIPLRYAEYTPQETLPSQSDFEKEGLFKKEFDLEDEYSLTLGNGIKISYFIQGPVRLRQFYAGNNPMIYFDLNKIFITAKFRFWVTKEGRVNQIVVEESSSFPLLDSDIMNFIKTWRFNPVYGPGTPSYEWGMAVFKVRR